MSQIFLQIRIFIPCSSHELQVETYLYPQNEGCGIAENYILLTYKNKLVKYNLSKYLIYPVNFQADWKGTIFSGCFLLTWEEYSYITMYSYKLFATMMAFQISYVNIQ